jgi:hypothetical protein
MPRLRSPGGDVLSMLEHPRALLHGLSQRYWDATTVWSNGLRRVVRSLFFDPRNNMPRTGRVLMARGRDAVDVAITNTFGPNTLTSFKVWTDEVENEPALLP